MRKGKIMAAALAAVMLVTGATGVKAETTNVGVGFTSETTQPGVDGDLAISWFPTDLNFGNAHNATGSAQTFPLLGAQERWLEVKDMRGTNPTTAEWKLTAAMSALTADAGVSLAGAKLNFKTGTDLYDNTGNLSAPHNGLPVYAGTAADLSTSNQFSLTATQAATSIMEQGTATGNEKVAMFMDNFELVIGGDAQAGKQYTGTLTWTLDDTI